jgi:hypothetical protein
VKSVACASRSIVDCSSLGAMFCSVNETLNGTGNGMIVWIDKGFTLCFYDTVTTSIVFTFIFVFGSIQYGFYK